ncbi:MAG: alpha/beta hydrolase [Deltaproteobacteria bacterium]|nr:alpha/beta hydrolase [Deltaproteobacteria bacterium]
MPIQWPVLISLIILGVIGFYFFYPWIENFFVFFPDRAHEFSPKTMHLDYEDVYFKTEDNKTLHGWFFPGTAASPVLIFFHGNAGNISHRLDNVTRLLEQGFGVFIFDYRGYGKSTGRPSEPGIYRDGLAAYDYLEGKKKVPPGQIILFGRSLGAAVAVEVALKRRVRALIMESAFTSTKDMAKTMPLFALLSPLLPTNYNNMEKVGRITVPKLIIHGDQDDIVPYAMGQKLFQAAKSPKFFYLLPNAGHNDTYVVGGPAYFQTLSDFAKNLKIGPSS